MSSHIFLWKIKKNINIPSAAVVISTIRNNILFLHFTSWSSLCLQTRETTSKNVFQAKCTDSDSSPICAMSHPGICYPLIHSIVSNYSDSEDPDQTVQMDRLIWAITVGISPMTDFCMARPTLYIFLFHTVYFTCILMLSILGKIFKRWYFEIFFLFFPENRIWHFM